MSHLDLQPCRWRRPSTILGRQDCLSPIVNAGPYGVMDHTCWMCPSRDHLDQAAPAQVLAHVGAVRHLIYHVWPANDRWRWHLDVLRRHMSLFTGRRIVSIAVGQGSAPAAEVEAALDGLDVELRIVANDPGLKELASYPRLLEDLSQHTGPQDVHYYGHAKGVVTEAWGPACRRWTEAMYEALLGHWPAVQRELEGHAAVGIFRRRWQGPVATRAKWHYSGAHRWVRHAELYSRDWRTIDPTWLGAETHVGLWCGLGESSCLYGEFATTDIGLYAESEWERWAEPRRRDWLAAHVGDRQEPLLATVILTACRQAELVHQAIASVQAQTSDAWQLLVVDAGELAAAGAYDRYGGDARIHLMLTGETREMRSARCMQGWAINQAVARRRVRGDLVLHLSDDDVLAPGWIAACLAHARAHPDQQAWYGPAERQQVHASGTAQVLEGLATCGVGSSANRLRGRADGMQVCVRRGAWRAWPEEAEAREQADGWWMDSVAEEHLIHPVQDLVGVHRHTPLSTFTRRVL